MCDVVVKGSRSLSHLLMSSCSSAEPKTTQPEVTTGNWKKKQCRTDTRLRFFSQRTVNRWNNLSQKDINATTLNSFIKSVWEKKKSRDGLLQRLMVYQVLLAARPLSRSERLEMEQDTMPGAAAPGKKNIGDFHTGIRQIIMLGDPCLQYTL